MTPKPQSVTRHSVPKEEVVGPIITLGQNTALLASGLLNGQPTISLMNVPPEFAGLDISKPVPPELAERFVREAVVIVLPTMETAVSILQAVERAAVLYNESLGAGTPDPQEEGAA